MSPAIVSYRTHAAMDNNTDVDGELLGEADEPPERYGYFSATQLTHSPRLDPAFIKHLPPAFARRESLLTRQLHSPDPEHTEDEHHRARAIVRGMSSCSNPSVASTASLTSDNDLTSPGTRDSTPSPPLPPTLIHAPVPRLHTSPLKEPMVAEEDLADIPKSAVEAELGRRRCITFACGRKPDVKVVEEKPQPAQDPISPPKRKCAITFACGNNKPNLSKIDTEVVKEKVRFEQRPAELPKRKSAITFACPSRPVIQASPSLPKIKIPRSSSPVPVKSGRAVPSPKAMPKVHRGSDSTVKNESPKSLRKIPSVSLRRRKYSDDNNDVPAEERRFHEFGPIQSEAEQWLEESTCHRNRLTVNDTLIKENIIRRMGEEAEEEALEDEEEFDEDDLEEDEEEDLDEDSGDDDVEEGASDDEVSDAGFQTDDEDGFAVSDSENDDDSDNEWWTAGRSTAATSTEHVDHLRISPRAPRGRSQSQSSMESGSDKNVVARPPQGKMRRKTKAMKIHRPGTPDLPDSTDFVCGTLDEDRPLEQAYISCLEQRKAAKHKARPQDIDPTFPTSDPEMDEEDDDSETDNNVDESDHPLFLHGNIDLNNEEPERRGRHPSITAIKKKSPSPPHQRLRSPPPVKRAVHRSPPPPTKRRSPAPAKRITHKSPPPPSRRLFGQSSPKRLKSPAPSHRRVASPAPSRRTSCEGTPPGISFTPRATLAQRPQPTHTASLPRVASTLKLGRSRLLMSPSSDNDDVSQLTTRGAIDIVKGLEKKRQRRREKLYQKHCNRAVKDREHRRPKPGKGAERMREVGLELAAYKGKKEHMLSY